MCLFHLRLKKLENGVNNKIKVNLLQILYIIFDLKNDYLKKLR